MGRISAGKGVGGARKGVCLEDRHWLAEGRWEYLVETARRNIEGEITLAESRQLIESYHKSTPVKLETPEGSCEVDFVSQHIAEAQKSLMIGDWV